MERAELARRFDEAGARARDFAQRYVREELPPALRFRVRLKSSYDGNPLHPDERTFDEDASFELARRLARCTAAEVIDVLWRGGAVPEWVDLCVAGIREGATLIELLVCGRYTENDALLYHQREGRPPFHVLGPILPPDWQEGTRFSVFHDSGCETRGELAELPSADVRHLALAGPDFDDEVLLALPALPELTSLRLVGAPITGPGLVALARLPRLANLGVEVAASRFTFPRLPGQLPLESLSLTELPPTPLGLFALGEAAPKLRYLSLGAQRALVLDGDVPPSVRELSIDAVELLGELAPGQLEQLSLRVAGTSPTELERCFHRLTLTGTLTLEGMELPADWVEQLAGRWPLRRLNLFRTGLTEAFAAQLRERHRGMRVVVR